MAVYGLNKKKYTAKKKYNSKKNFKELAREKKLVYKLSHEVKIELAKIGIPEAVDFIADSFQLEAVEKIANTDVIVSAPTGSGKTWIAIKAIEKELSIGGRIWYASPLKALSNGKYQEFIDIFGSDNVGLITGDHKVNIEAPIIVGTTEILRNQLYSAMAEGKDIDSSLVILDEAHYLGDEERGVVWEEVLIYLPSRVRILLLSATIANASEVAAWLENNRNHQCQLVQGGKRPVQLTALCLWPDGFLKTLNQTVNSSKILKFKHLRTPLLSLSQVMECLSRNDLLPAIFFLKSRLDCDRAVKMKFGEDEKLAERQQLVQEYLLKYPHLEDYQNLSSLVFKGLAAHHAGHLPHYKILVEELMSKGLLNAIFATSTVSAGVNFPARTVVIGQSDRFNGLEFQPLSANEFTQMTGRAGRRGHDNIGFVFTYPAPHNDLKLLSKLMEAAPEPVESRLKINFSMVLNLLNSHEVSDIKNLLARSLANYQLADRGLSEKNLKSRSNRLWFDFKRHLAFLKKEKLVDKENHLTDQGQWAAELRLDHPLVFYAGVISEAWPKDGALLAAAVASIVWDKDSRNSTLKDRPSTKLVNVLKRLVVNILPMIERLEEAGFDTPLIKAKPAWAIWVWANNGDFDRAVEILGLGPGDLANLALRTADHLRQIIALKGRLDDNLVEAAREALYRLLQEPVSLPLEI